MSLLVGKCVPQSILTSIRFSDILIFRMQQVQINTIVRDRGQITLPDEIRKLKTWASSQSVITISASENDEIIITPYTKTKKHDWDKVWSAIKKARAIKGKGGSLSAFIAKDRLSHF